MSSHVKETAKHVFSEGKHRRYKLQSVPVTGKSSQWGSDVGRMDTRCTPKRDCSNKSSRGSAEIAAVVSRSHSEAEIHILMS